MTKNYSKRTRHLVQLTYKVKDNPWITSQSYFYLSSAFDIITKLASMNCLDCSIKPRIEVIRES